MLSITLEQTAVGSATPSRPDVVPPGVVFSAPLAAADIADVRRLFPPPARIRGGLPPGALRRVREYIDAHLDEKVSVELLAGVAGLSTFHFARAFKQSEGVAPHEHLIQRRIRRAMELLAGTDLSISEVAAAAGFSDQSHCARLFRERVGLCPRDYRWSAEIGRMNDVEQARLAGSTSIQANHQR